MSGVRKPAVSGAFYPAGPKALREEVAGYLGAVPLYSGARPEALVVPHAGYPYSGLAAAAAYRAVEGLAFDTVLLFGPAHRVWFEGVSVSPYTSYRTPLGDIPVDQTAAAALLEAGGQVGAREEAHSLEHSLEVQLPFLQTVLAPGFSILPLLFGGSEPPTLPEAFFEKALEGKRVLWICSTDLSHDAPYDVAVLMDGRVRDALEALDRDALEKIFLSGEGEACGRLGLLELLRHFRSETHTAAITAFTNSGEVVGDRASRIVGYLSAIISRRQS